MGRALLIGSTLLGCCACCAFFSAACAAAFWRTRSRGNARLRALMVLLAIAMLNWMMFNVSMSWERGPGYRPESGSYLQMAAAMAVGTGLAVRYGTAREVLTATGWSLGLVFILGFLSPWSAPMGAFHWLAALVATVPSVLGLVFAPALLDQRLSEPRL